MNRADGTDLVRRKLIRPLPSLRQTDSRKIFRPPSIAVRCLPPSQEGRSRPTPSTNDVQGLILLEILMIFVKSFKGDEDGSPRRRWTVDPVTSEIRLGICPQMMPIIYFITFVRAHNMKK